MKGTATGLAILGVYWILQGISEIRSGNTNGIVILVLGAVLLPVAKYVWGKNLDGTSSAK
jgi:hypothetical protein